MRRIVYYWSRIAAVLAGVLLVSCRREVTPTALELGKASREHERQSLANLEWYEKHLIRGYLGAAAHDPQWDETITNAIKIVAMYRAGRGLDGDFTNRILLATDAAIAQGCKDPYVAYLNLRFRNPGFRNVASEAAVGFYNAAGNMESWLYPPDMVFHAEVRAAEALQGLQGTNTVVPPEGVRMRMQAVQKAVDFLNDSSAPPVEIYSVCSQLLELQRHTQVYTYSWQQLEPPLFKHWGNTPYPHLLKAEYHYNLAWSARGGGYANSVGKEEWKAYSKEMGIAEKSFRAAWRIDNTRSETARWMIEICTCQSEPRAEMEKWFERAMLTDPYNRAACKAKTRFLEPKWGGSAEAMIEFGRQCITNRNFKGDIPTVIVDVYNTIAGYYDDPAERSKFYRVPQVWNDIQAAYDEIRLRQPGATWYHDYLAWYALKCGQWDAAELELALLNPPNYSFFGGEANFKKLVEDLKKRRK